MGLSLAKSQIIILYQGSNKTIYGPYVYFWLTFVRRQLFFTNILLANFTHSRPNFPNHSNCVTLTWRLVTSSLGHITNHFTHVSQPLLMLGHIISHITHVGSPIIHYTLYSTTGPHLDKILIPATQVFLLTTVHAFLKETQKPALIVKCKIWKNCLNKYF